MTITIDHLSDEINETYKTVKNWRKVATRFDITSGLAYRIAVEKYDPKDPQLRVKLGLPALIPTPACTRCGVVHHLGEICPTETPIEVVVYQMTAEELAKIDQPVTIIFKKPKSTRKRPARPRASINIEDPKSAACTIVKKMDAEKLAELIDFLVTSRNGGSSDTP